MSHTSTLATLGYHKIGAPSPGAWETWYYVPEEIFRKQLAVLAAHGWEFIGADALWAALTGGAPLPPRAALITFDDGYRSLRDAGLRVLREFGAQAIVFVPTDFIGSSNTWDQDVEPPEPICGWEDLAALEQAGVSVQSHARSHPAFSRLTPQEQLAELAESKALLEARLGPRHFFSFPYGDAGKDPAATAALVQQCGYHAAFLYAGGPTRWPPPSLYALPRITMGPETDLLEKVVAAAAQL